MPSALKPYLRDVATSAAAARGDAAKLSALWLSATGSNIEDDDPRADAAALYQYIGEWIEEHVTEDDTLSADEERNAIRDAREILRGAQS